jgi:hypothetical protein
MAKAARVANTQGGAQSRRVTVGLYPSVAARAGKNALDEREMMIQVMLQRMSRTCSLGVWRMTYFDAVYIVFQSVSASKRICSWLLTSV